MKELYFHSDPGHGWLAVKRQALVEAGVEKEISHYSYQRGQTVYLEEDCDAGKYLDTLKAAGVEFAFKERIYPSYHPIRSYDRFVT